MDDAEDPGDGPEALMDIGIALMTHSMVIYALMVSWYPRGRPNNPTGDVMMDLDPWRSLGVVEEDRSLEEVLGPTLSGLMTLQPLLGSWSSYMMLVTLYGP